MSSRHLVHPELQQFLDEYPTADLDRDRLDFLRRNRTAQCYTADDIVKNERLLSHPDGSHAVKVFLYEPHDRKRPSPAVLHIHGGGFVLGKAEESERSNQNIARELGCLVVSVDYRLAPETRFPGAIKDCYAALAWLHDTQSELGIDTSKIAVKGESAGGGLAACLAIMARDSGCYPIALQMLGAPMLDDRPASAQNLYAGEFIWTRASNAFGWECYLGDLYASEQVPAYAAAARESKLSNLPPAYVAVGALDLFLGQNLEYVHRLNCAGVATELHVYPGAYHSFHRAGDTSVNRKFENDFMAALKAAFEEASP